MLRRETRQWQEPVVTEIARTTQDPFRVLISCLLSLRTRDEVTALASRRLFAAARTPQAMLRVSAARIARLVYPVGFYRTKARRIREISRELLRRFGGRVPSTIEELLTLNGVGRKTANLVVTEGFGKLGICVDTHVHRISNRLGVVRTKTPEQTEFALRACLPKRHWIVYNELLVTFGKRICQPVSPWCSRCPIARWCARAGVTRSR